MFLENKSSTLKLIDYNYAKFNGLRSFVVKNLDQNSYYEFRDDLESWPI